MLMRMAWRNLWRNPRRSLITLCAMTFSLTLMVVATNLMEGMNRQMVGYAADRSLGHMQAHAKGYYEDRGLHDTLALSILDSFEGSSFLAAPRAYAFGLAGLGEQSAGVQIRGIDPQIGTTSASSGSDRPVYIVGRELTGLGDHQARSSRMERKIQYVFTCFLRKRDPETLSRFPYGAWKKG